MSAPAAVIYRLGGKCSRFSAQVGVDDSSTAGMGTVRFQVIADGETLFDSGNLNGTAPAMAVDVSLTGKTPPQAAGHQRRRRLRAGSRELGRREGRVRALERSRPACSRCGARRRAARGRAAPPRRPPPASVHRLASPGGHIEVAVRAAPDLAYDVSYDGKPLLTDARLLLDVDHRRLGAGARITATKRQSVDGTVVPPSA